VCLGGRVELLEPRLHAVVVEQAQALELPLALEEYILAEY